MGNWQTLGLVLVELVGLGAALAMLARGRLAAPVGLRQRMPVADETGAIVREGRVLVAGVVASAPALAFGFDAPAALAASAGLLIAAALVALALRPSWRTIRWLGVGAAAVWVLIGGLSGGPASAPLWFSAVATVAAFAGLWIGGAGALAAGFSLAALAGAALLWLGVQTGFAGPAGVTFAVAVAAAALVGASSLRLEGAHFAAFVAAIAGLFLLSGQAEAAIWFTPAASWAGALFFAIAVLRAPVLGARGMLLASAGVAAPLLSVAMLRLSGHGLTEDWAAGLAFAALVAGNAGLLLLSARRRTLPALGATRFVLVAGGVVATAFACAVSTTSFLVAAAMSALALGFAEANRRFPDAAWRLGAATSALIAAGAAWVLLSAGWPAPVAATLGLAIPAALLSIAARVAGGARIAALLEALAIACAAAALHSTIRYVLGARAPELAPLGFVEAGFHIAAAATLALLLSFGAAREDAAVRRIGAAILALAALAASMAAALLWLTPYWSLRPPAALDWPPLLHGPLGFLLPAFAAWAHFAFWRRRRARARARLAFAAATLLSAGYAALEIVQARHGDAFARVLDGTTSTIGAAAFGLAILVNIVLGGWAADGGTLTPRQRKAAPRAIRSSAPG